MHWLTVSIIFYQACIQLASSNCIIPARILTLWVLICQEKENVFSQCLKGPVPCQSFADCSKPECCRNVEMSYYFEPVWSSENIAGFCILGNLNNWCSDNCECDQGN
jgi:hypothetical protein